MKRFVRFLTAFALAAGLLTVPARQAYADGSAPVAENLELRTYREVSVGGSLCAYDPDNDILDFTITTQPVKGTIELEEDGSFIYTPAEGKKGRDYFGYKAVDAQGNTSQEATVIIRIEKQRKDVFYTDMRGRADEYDAVRLCELDIFTGEQMGGRYCFSPEKSVSRGEFLSSCMLVSKQTILETAVNTGYSDDKDIPAWMKNYVASAVMCGLCAVSDRADQSFNAEESISCTEAVLLLDKAMNLTAVSYLPLSDEYGAELAQACANLTACGVINSQVDEQPLTRAEMAQMLSSAAELMEKR